VEHGKKIIAMEVKSAGKIRQKDIKSLRVFLEQYPQTVLGLVAYNGSEVIQLGKKIFGLPISYLL